MRFTVEQWSPEYGAPASSQLAEPAQEPQLDVEFGVESWRPLQPSGAAASRVLFVDGVRRVDANVWIDDGGRMPVLGLCAVYAAGAVACDGQATLEAAEVRRGLFTASAHAADVKTMHGTYSVSATAGATPEELWLGIQRRMGELETKISQLHSDGGLVIVDGPLSHRGPATGAVGFIKTQHVEYLPDELVGVMISLAVGERTPLFLLAGGGFSWYMRLPFGDGSVRSGLVRCEVDSNRSPAGAAELADTVTVTLPRFASQPHKEPRAPQNLYPIAGLERELRRRLGDAQLMYRALRVAAAGAA